MKFGIMSKVFEWIFISHSHKASLLACLHIHSALFHMWFNFGYSIFHAYEHYVLVNLANLFSSVVIFVKRDVRDMSMVIHLINFSHFCCVPWTFFVCCSQDLFSYKPLFRKIFVLITINIFFQFICKLIFLTTVDPFWPETSKFWHLLKFWS